MLNKYNNDRHAMVIIDIDNFKMINDEKGHLYG
ncbi:MAG: diguanylate cyclase, partial [Clostridiales bacterium]|nr:diguanylate cyclase [Clostridiales bacterium]